MRTALAAALAITLVLVFTANVALAQNDDPFGGGGFAADPFNGEEVDDPFGDAGQPAKAAPKTRRSTRRQPFVTAVLSKPPARIWASPDSVANAPIRKKLAESLTSTGLDFSETPLSQIVEFLRDEYEMEVQLDHVALDEIGVDVDEPITCQINHVSLNVALRLMLSRHELMHLPADGYLLITSQEECEQRPRTAIYPVSDLGQANLQQAAAVALPQQGGFGRGGGGFGGGAMPQTRLAQAPLVDAIVSCIAQDTWAVNGGNAELRLLPAGMLVVSQTEEVHDQVLALLEAMRKAPASPAAPTAVFAAPIAPSPFTAQPLQPPQPANQQQFDFGGGGQF